MKRFKFFRTSVALALLSGAVVACGSSGETSGDGGYYLYGDEAAEEPGSQYDPSVDGDGATAPPGDASGDDGLPDEIESVDNFRAPVVTGSLLWTANPSSGRIALIDAESYDVQILTAGLRPTWIAALPVGDGAAGSLVINEGSDDVSVFHVDAEKAVTERKVSIHDGANRIRVGEKGEWAVVWTQAEEGEVLKSTQGFQELTVLQIAADTSKDVVPTPVAVGYRPSQVQIFEELNRAIVVAEDGVSVISLGETVEITEWISVSDGSDVSIAPDGKHLTVLESGSSEVDIYALDDVENPETLSFSARVTDLDISGTGVGVAVVRKEHEVHLFDVASAAAGNPTVEKVTIPDETIGSVDISGSGNRALLFTNAAEISRITILTLEEGDEYLDFRSMELVSPVLRVVTSEAGDFAAVVTETYLAGTGSFSVVSLAESRFPRVVGTKGNVKDIELGASSLIVSSEGNTPQVHLVDLQNLSSRTQDLGNTPLAAGLIEDLSSAFVSEEHPEGRLSFVSTNSSSVRTLTGFELSADVISE